MPDEFTAANAGTEPINEPASNEPAGGAAPEGTATPQSNEPAAQPAEGQQQDVTQTQAFAARLKESTQKAAQQAVDAEYDRLYGNDYNIHSKADYDAYIAQQEAERQRQEFQQQTGLNPDALKPIFEQWKKTDPDFQELGSLRSKTRTENAINNFASEFPELGIKKFEDLQKLPNLDAIAELVGTRGMSLNEAYKLANYESLISGKIQAAQQDTLRKISQNGASSPGALGGTGDPTPTDVWGMSDKDFKAMQERALRGELKRN